MLTATILCLGITIALVLLIGARSAFKPPLEWKSNTADVATSILLEDIARARQRILVFGGTGHTYNDQKVLDALEKKNIPIEMIFQNEKIYSTPVSDLARKKQNIYLVSMRNALPKRHFRVVDWNYVYIEKDHDPQTTARYYKRLFNTRFLPGKYSREFYKIKLDISNTEDQ